MLKELMLLLTLLVLSACHDSGTWKEDADNWERIFQSEKPVDITIVHSKYWRSPHFTFEYEYFIQIQKNPDFQNKILNSYPMVEVVDKNSLEKMAQWSDSRPEWFAPKSLSHYQIWRYADLPDSSYRLLIDKETGDVFLTDIQL